MSSVTDRVLKVTSDQLDHDIGDNQSLRLYEDLGADSLDLVELAMAIEEEFDDENVELTDEIVHTWTDVSSVIVSVAEQVK